MDTHVMSETARQDFFFFFLREVFYIPLAITSCELLGSGNLL